MNDRTAISTNQLIDKLSKAGYIEPKDKFSIKDFLELQKHIIEPTLFIRILIGIGAFLTALFVMGFLNVAHLIDFNNYTSLLIWSMAFIAAGLFIFRLTKDENTLRDNVKLQISFCAITAGKILYIIGMTSLLGNNNLWQVTLNILVITALIYPFYRVSADRFIWSLLFLISLTGSMLFDPIKLFDPAIGINLSYFIQVFLIIVLFTQLQFKLAWKPIAYALVFSVIILSWMPDSDSIVIYMKLVTSMALLGLITWAATTPLKMKSTPVLLAYGLAIVLGITVSPSITLSLCLLILGYAKHDRLITTLGIILMPCALFMYYYNLQVTLLTKSLLLIFTGTCFLLARFYLERKTQHRELNT